MVPLVGRRDIHDPGAVSEMHNKAPAGHLTLQVLITSLVDAFTFSTCPSNNILGAEMSIEFARSASVLRRIACKLCTYFNNPHFKLCLATATHNLL